MIKICQECHKKFRIIELEQKFYERKKLLIPENCPNCRQQKRLSLRNESTLYKRICDKCHKDILSTYGKDSPYTVYCQECFHNSLI